MIIYICKWCRSEFNNTIEYNKHTSLDICKKTTHVCKFCFKKFMKSNSMYRHMKHTCKKRTKTNDAIMDNNNFVQKKEDTNNYDESINCDTCSDENTNYDSFNCNENTNYDTFDYDENTNYDSFNCNENTNYDSFNCNENTNYDSFNCNENTNYESFNCNENTNYDSFNCNENTNYDSFNCNENTNYDSFDYDESTNYDILDCNGNIHHDVFDCNRNTNDVACDRNRNTNYDGFYCNDNTNYNGLIKNNNRQLMEKEINKILTVERKKMRGEIDRTLMVERRKIKNEIEQQIKERERRCDPKNDYNNRLREDARKSNTRIINNTVKNNTINNNMININNNVVINNMQLIGYGKEDLSKIDSKEILSAMNHGYDIVLKLTETIHFNPKHPEFHNLCITNTNDQYGKMYDGNAWIKLTKKNLVNKVYDDKKDYVEDNRNDFINKLQPSRKKALDNWLYMDDEHKRIQQTKSDLKLLMYNKRNMVNNNSNKLIIG
jgi:hypothetical protein